MTVFGSARTFACLCACQEAVVAAQEAARRQHERVQQQRTFEAQLGDAGMSQVAHLTLDCFARDLLLPDRYGRHPVDLAVAWIDSWLAGGDRAQPATVRAAAALYCYSPAPHAHRRGKTHLTAALALRARAAGWFVAWANERAYLERRASGERDPALLTRLVGTSADLTVLDDLGISGNPRAAEAWYGVLDRRALCRKPLLITSNFTPEELITNGTLDSSGYARLRELLGDGPGLICFRGPADLRPAAAGSDGEEIL